jgi:hypothetical protein
VARLSRTNSERYKVWIAVLSTTTAGDHVGGGLHCGGGVLSNSLASSCDWRLSVDPRPHSEPWQGIIMIARMWLSQGFQRIPKATISQYHQRSERTAWAAVSSRRYFQVLVKASLRYQPLGKRPSRKTRPWAWIIRDQSCNCNAITTSSKGRTGGSGAARLQSGIHPAPWQSAA